MVAISLFARPFTRTWEETVSLLPMLRGSFLYWRFMFPLVCDPRLIWNNKAGLTNQSITAINCARRAPCPQLPQVSNSFPPPPDPPSHSLFSFLLSHAHSHFPPTCVKINPCPTVQATAPGHGDKGGVYIWRLRPGETAASETAVLSARCRDGDGWRGPQQIIAWIGLQSAKLHAW